MVKYLCLVVMLACGSCKAPQPNLTPKTLPNKDTVEVKINRLVKITKDRQTVVFSITVTNSRKEAVGFLNHPNSIVGSVFSDYSPSKALTSAIPSIDFVLASARDAVILLPGQSKNLEATAYLLKPLTLGARYKGVVEIAAMETGRMPRGTKFPEGVKTIALWKAIRSTPFAFNVNDK